MPVYRSVVGKLIEVNTNKKTITLENPVSGEEGIFSYEAWIQRGKLTEDWIRTHLNETITITVKDKEVFMISP